MLYNRTSSSRSVMTLSARQLPPCLFQYRAFPYPSQTNTKRSERKTQDQNCQIILGNDPPILPAFSLRFDSIRFDLNPSPSPSPTSRLRVSTQSKKKLTPSPRDSSSPPTDPTHPQSVLYDPSACPRARPSAHPLGLPLSGSSSL
jgi:hypothetical protein